MLKWVKRFFSDDPEDTKVEIAFTFTRETLAELDKIRERSGLIHRYHLFNEAVSLFDFILENVEKSGKLPVLLIDGEEIELTNDVFCYAVANSLANKTTQP